LGHNPNVTDIGRDRPRRSWSKWEQIINFGKVKCMKL